MGSGYAKRKKQAKMLQEQMAKMQEQLADSEFTGTAGGGLVTVVLNGHREVKSVKIKPDCVDPEDVEGLEDLVRAAFNDALKQAEDATPDLSNLSGEIPGLGSLPPGLF